MLSIALSMILGGAFDDGRVELTGSSPPVVAGKLRFGHRSSPPPVVAGKNRREESTQTVAAGRELEEWLVINVTGF